MAKTAKIILDRNLSTEFELPADHIYEDFKNKSIHISAVFKIGEDDIPDFSPMQGRTTVKSIEIEDSGIQIPVSGEYDTIDIFQTSYNAGSREYVYNLDISKKEE